MAMKLEEFPVGVPFTFVGLEKEGERIFGFKVMDDYFIVYNNVHCPDGEIWKISGVGSLVRELTLNEVTERYAKSIR